MSGPAAATATATSRDASRVETADAGGRTEGILGVAVLAAVLAACSILYEFTAAQTLALLAANTVVWYSITVGLYLLGMGLGAFAARRLSRNLDPWTGLFRVEIALTLLGAALVPVVHLAHMTHAHLLHAGHARWATTVFFGTAFLASLAVGALTGLELPLLYRIARRGGRPVAATHPVLGADYLGTLAGSLAFPLLLLPHWPLLRIGLFVAGVNLAVAGVILALRLDGSLGAGRRSAVVCGVAAGLIALNLGSPRIEQYFLRKFYYARQSVGSLRERFAPMGGFPVVERVRSPYQAIDLVADVAPDFTARLMGIYSRKRERDPAYPRDRVLFLNGDLQFNTSFDEVYHEWFAHVPVVAAGKAPAEILLLGGGDGLLARELLKYRGVRSITHVDIDPVLPRLSLEHPVLRAASGGALADPRVERVRSDGFAFVRDSRRRWDAIYIDFPVAVDYDLARLYSREFFRFVRRRLRDGGYACFDATGIGLVSVPAPGREQTLDAANDWPVYYHTLLAAGWGTIVPYLTTLEVENDAARAVLDEAASRLPPGSRHARLFAAAPTEEERDALRGAFVRDLLEAHVYMLQQGFVLLSPRESPFTLEWRDPGVPLDVLTEERFTLSFRVRFPAPPEVDPSLVNSILRPTLPTSPVWAPRRAF